MVRISKVLGFVAVAATAVQGAGAVVTDDTARSKLDTYIHTFIDTDDFEGSRTCSAPVYRASNGVLVAMQIVEKNGHILPAQIQLTHIYEGDWHRYHRAAAKGGRDLPFDVIDRSVVHCYTRPCQLSETVQVRQSVEELRALSGGELHIRVYGTQGRVDVLIPGPYIAGFLMRFDEDMVREADDAADGDGS